MSPDPVRFEDLLRCLEATGLPFSVADAPQHLLGILPTRLGTQMVVASLDLERQVVVLRAPRLVLVPPERRAEVARAALYANFQLLLGGFALDLQDGELLFQLTVPCLEVGLAPAQIGHCLRAIAWSLSEYLPALLRLSWSPATVEDVLDIPDPSPLEALLQAVADEDGSAA